MIQTIPMPRFDTSLLTTPPAPVAPSLAAQLPAPGAPKAAVKKLKFGAAAVKKEETKTAYPKCPDPNGQIAALAATIIRQTSEMEALDGSLTTTKAELKFMVAPVYFRANQGQHEAPSSVSVDSTEGEVLVCFQNRYKGLPDESSVQAILGEEVTAKYFQQSYTLKINGEDLSAARVAKPVAIQILPAQADGSPAGPQEFLDALNDLLTAFGCPGALEVKAEVKPIKAFHAARHLELTPEINLEVEQACPIIAMIKTKGRK